MMIMIMMSLSFRCDSMAASMFCFCFNQEMMDGIFQWDSMDIFFAFGADFMEMYDSMVFEEDFAVFRQD